MHEIPDELKSLYKHWNKHTIRPKSKVELDLNKKVLSEMVYFINQRMKAWEFKTQGKNYSDEDEIISKYRFCNIYRELDRQTIAIHKMLADLESNFPIWLLNVAFCRFVCSPETVSKVGLLNFDEENNKKVYDNLIKMERPKYGSAYVFPISSIQRGKHPTRELFFCLYLPKVIPKIAIYLEKLNNSDIVSALPELLEIFGFGLKFHWTEILIDVAYQYPNLINLFGRFPIGPGSKPTMNLLNSNEKEEDVILSLVNYQPEEFDYLSFNGKKVYLSAENWEGIGCEFRKYSNLNNGEGRKRLYS